VGVAVSFFFLYLFCACRGVVKVVGSGGRWWKVVGSGGNGGCCFFFSNVGVSVAWSIVNWVSAAWSIVEGREC
jgi:hypothetical protein